jgi:capsular exopolysaccharide synthesis family protein
VQQDPEGLNLEKAFRALRRRAPLILLCVVLAAAAAFGFSKHEQKKYVATAAVVFTSNSLNQQVAGLSTSGGGSSSLTQQGSNLELFRLSKAPATAASVLGGGLTEAKVAGSVSVGPEGETNIFNVSATSASPTLAADLANTYVQQFVKEQQSADRRYYRSALALVKKQLSRLSRAQRLGEDGLDLQDRAQALSLLTELQYNNVQIAHEALVPASPSSPRTSRDAALGALLGLLIGLALAFMLERLDRRIRGPEDLASIYRLPMLGIVPESRAFSRSARDRSGGTVRLPYAEAEAFSLIRAHLRFFNVDRDLRTVLVASPAPGDGKTTVARCLAEAAARLGSRVLLLEADLRHPTLSAQLDTRPGPGPGLADVLIDTIAMGDAIQRISVEAEPGEGAEGRTLDVLPAGTVLPPNPGELLESRAMLALLERAKFAYELVVIDTPPLIVVSDAFALLNQVDGVVVVGRIGRSRRDAAERLQQVLSSCGATLLGVIANGSKATDAYARGYAKGNKSSTAVSAASVVPHPEGLAPTAKT